MICGNISYPNKTKMLHMENGILLAVTYGIPSKTTLWTLAIA